MPYVTWLADVLRAAEVPVIEEPGWKSRGRGPMREVKGVLCHHTGPGSTENLKNLIRDGRSDLPGPLSQLFLAKDGVFYVLGAGRCNHAGRGKWQGVTNGNSHFIGIEAQNAGDGKDPWPEVQINSYVRGTAAILEHINADDVMAAGHKEYALPKGRKVDPTFNMTVFREAVNQAMGGVMITAPTPPQTDPKYSMLRKGSQGADVKKLQHLLGITADGAFGPKTEAAVKKFQQLTGLVADGLVGPKTWDALLKK